MALQSSGQITLAEVRNEFFGNTGTTQFAISGLYGKGNAPASSGEIQLAADFYGTSSSLYTTTITAGRRASNAKLDIYEYGFSLGQGTGGVTYGSMGDNTFTDSSGTNKTIFGCRTGGNSGTANSGLIFQIGSTTNYTNWTSITLTRTADVTATVLRANMNSTNFNGYTQYSTNIGVSAIFVNGAQTTLTLT